MTSHDFIWLHMTSHDFKWLQMISNDFKILQLTSNDFKRLQMTLDDFKWFWLNHSFTFVNLKSLLFIVLTSWILHPRISSLKFRNFVILIPISIFKPAINFTTQQHSVFYCLCYGNSLLHFLDKNFVRTTNDFTKEIARVDFTEYFFGGREFLIFLHCSFSKKYDKMML